MQGLIIFILVYAVGFVISLFLMHKYKEQLEIDHYDPPHPDGYYDDWNSNAEAYVGFSAMWPIWWALCGIAGFYKLLQTLSLKIGESVSKKNK